MKNISRKKIDVLAKIQKSKKFQESYKDSMVKTRLAVEIYNARKQMEWSQQKLAKKINSTQKVISKLENADVNVGIELLRKIFDEFNFNSDTLARIFNRHVVFWSFGSNPKNSETKTEFSKSEENKIKYL
jgi:ribosome-binding protein aMBF1 (putative translation factor)